jgi:hypothetical protein
MAASGGSGTAGKGSAAGSTALGAAGRDDQAGTGGKSAAGGSSAAGASEAGEGGAAGAAGATEMNLVPLPAGSREVNGIVNLVSADAAASLDTFLLDQSLTLETERHDTRDLVNLFLTYYEERYDFVFFFTDHNVPNVAEAGVTEVVTNQPVPGGSDQIKIALDGYRTTGRLKSAIGIPYVPNFLPPLGHEVLHYWANYLDTSFGFGIGLNQNWGPHWGCTSVNGQLGGFDGSTLHCQSPADAMLSACDASSTGRYRYTAAAFAPNANEFKATPYSPLELYLMGLAPATEVPESFLMLRDASFPNGDDVSQPTVVVEASGVDTLPFSAITARHGTAPLLPADQRAFSAAFVVISAMPAADSVLTEVATLAAGFSGQQKVDDRWPSFADLTGGRATMSTTLGPRRSAAHPVPDPRPALTCDLLAQDCPDGLTCYALPTTVCAVPGPAAIGDTCSSVLACAPGGLCVAPDSSSPLSCRKLCDWKNNGAANACQTLCPSTFVTFADDANNVFAAFCP